MTWSKKIILGAATLTSGWSILLSGVFVKDSQDSSEQKSIPDDYNSAYILLDQVSVQSFNDDLKSPCSSLHWNLLQLTKSKDRNIRHKAIKSLVDISNLNLWQQRALAQAIDSRTAIGLARLPKTSTSFFLYPPFENNLNDNLKEEFLKILSTLPVVENEICLKILLKRLLEYSTKFQKNAEEWSLEPEEPFLLYQSERQKNREIDIEKLCLETLLSHSAIKDNRKTLLENGILKLLFSVLKYHENDIEFQSLIAQIMANIAMEEKYENHFHLTGWIKILALWSKSSHVEVCLPAIKALANMDRDDFHYCCYDNDVFLLYPHVRQSNATEHSADIIFVHGLMGATFWTWRQNDRVKKHLHDDFAYDIHSNTLNKSYTFCWPKDWLAEDFPNVRLISADYNTCITTWGARCPSPDKDNLEGRAKCILEKLLISKVGEKPIIWITHSMGGLLVKQMLMEAVNSDRAEIKSIAEKTKGIIFMSVPHKGSNLASIFQSASYIFQPSIDISQLQIGSPKLEIVHENFIAFAKQNSINILSFGETKKSKWGLTFSLLVSEESANIELGKFYNLPVDHLSTCKPDSKDAKLYILIRKFLRENIPLYNVSREMFSLHDIEILNVFCLI